MFARVNHQQHLHYIMNQFYDQMPGLCKYGHTIIFPQEGKTLIYIYTSTCYSDFTLWFFMLHAALSHYNAELFSCYSNVALLLCDLFTRSMC